MHIILKSYQNIFSGQSWIYIFTSSQ